MKRVSKCLHGIGYFITVLISIGIAFWIEWNGRIEANRVLRSFAISIALIICNVIIYRRFVLFYHAYKYSINKFKAHSDWICLIGIVFYITMLGTLLLLPDGDEFVATIAFWPLVLAALLQNVIYIGESELTTFNKKILMRDIQKVKIEKSILWTYIVSIYDDISKSPKTINISKRYIHAFYKELNLKNIKIELKGFDVEGI